MGLLDDAIREHLELKRAHGADEAEVRRLEQEALGPPRTPGELASAAPAGEPAAPAAVPEPDEPPEPPAALDTAAEDAPAAVPVGSRPQPVQEDPEPWLDEPDEVPPGEALQHDAPAARPADAAPAEDDVLEETPEFLQETPEHDRLWFEQKPPRGFDFDR